MLENESTVDAGQEQNVDAQEVEPVVVAEQVEGATSEVATEQPDKQVQSREDNAKFAEVRREAERKAEDRLISQMYGESHGIHTKADYDKAVREQRESEMIEQLRQDEADPKAIKEQLFKEWEKNDPRLKEYEQIRTESHTQKQLAELNTDLKEMGIDAIGSLDDIAKLPSADTIIKHISDGKTLAEAYFLANKSDIIKSQATKIQQDIITKTALLDGASPGALDNSGGDTSASIFKMSQSEFDKMKEDALMGRARK